MNNWNADAKKDWVRARLTGRAATAWKRLAEGDRDSCEHIIAALKKRFEPECRKEVFMAEFQRRSKKSTEDWASFWRGFANVCGEGLPYTPARGTRAPSLEQIPG